jgi:DNA-binding MarR family transcriptional regulator
MATTCREFGALSMWLVSGFVDSDVVPGPVQSAEQLLLQMSSFGQGVSDSMGEATGRPDLMGNTPLRVLCLLDLDGPARPSAISEAVGLTSGGMTKLLDRLEAAGLVERSYGVITTDHRGVSVALTGEGRRTIRLAAEALIDHLPDVSEMVKSIVSLLESLLGVHD